MNILKKFQHTKKQGLISNKVDFLLINCNSSQKMFRFVNSFPFNKLVSY